MKKDLHLYTLMMNLAVVAIWAVVLNACSWHMPVFAKDKQSASGFQYFLGKDRIVISGEVIYQKTKQVKKDLSIDEGHFKFAAVDAQVDLVTGADIEHGYYLDLSHGAFTENDLDVTSDASGILLSVNTTTVGKAGDVIKNVTKFVATLLPVFGILEANTVKATEEFEKIASFKEKKGDELLELRNRFEDLPPVAMLYLTKNHQGATIWRDMVLIDYRIALLKKRRHSLQQGIDNADTKEFERIKARVDYINGTIEEATNERNKLKSVFDVGLNGFQLAEGIGTVTKKVPFTMELELTDLPPSNLLRAGLTPTKVGKLLVGNIDSQNSEEKKNTKASQAEKEKYEKAEALWKKAWIVVAASGYRQPALNPSGKEAKKEDLRVHYRRKTPIILSVYKRASIPVDSEQDLKDRLVLVSRKVEHVLHPSSKPMEITFNKNCFTKRVLGLTFDSKGVLTSLSRESGASATEATAAFSEAATASLTALQNSLLTFQKIEQARRDIRLDRVKGEIDLLKGQKNHVDAKLALEGANASAELVRQQQTLEAQLNTKNAEFALLSAESAQELKHLEDQAALLDAQLFVDEKTAIFQLVLGQKKLEAELKNLNAKLDLDKSATTAEEQILLEELKSQIDVLRQQIDLMKIREELDELKRIEKNQ